MLGNGRLSDAELRADDCDDLPRRLLFVEEQFEDPPADRVTEDIEGVHLAIVSRLPYIRYHLCSSSTPLLPGPARWHEQGRGYFEGLARHSDTSSTKRSMEGGSVDELLDVTVERPVLDQLQVEVGRTLEDRVQPGLTGDDREERDLHTVD